MYGFGELIDGMLFLLLITSVLALFGVWKIIEIIIWLFQHVSIAW